MSNEVPRYRGYRFPPDKALEHFVLMELVAHASYTELEYPIRFWRTKSGREVDFVLGDGEIAIGSRGQLGWMGATLVDSRPLRPHMGRRPPYSWPTKGASGGWAASVFCPCRTF
jgi:hypothetical protein